MIRKFFMLRKLGLLFFVCCLAQLNILAFAESKGTNLAQKAQSESVKKSDEFLIISKIEIIGNQTLSQEAVINLLTIKVGDMPTKNTIRENIKILLETGYFSDVHVAQKTDGTLVFHIQEKPTLRHIGFEGFSVVDVSTFDDKLLTKPYSILNEKHVLADLKTIEKSYIENGYYLAKATYVLKATGYNSFDIIFKVQENTPITIRKINLLGNEAFSDAELKNFMITKAYTWLAFMNNSGVYRDEFLDADQNNLTYYYRDNGYAEATIATPTAVLDRSKTNVEVSFYIEQGERYSIGKINITGNLIFSDEDLKKVLTLKEGDYYSISKFSNDMKNLKNYYGDRGYAFTYVYPTFDIDRKNKTYDITYNITPGTKAYFRTISITGNDKTRDNVIRRALKISEGELFNATKLENSKADVEYLGFFSGVEKVETLDPSNGFVDVKISVIEKSTGQFRASLGASPSSFGGGNVRVFGDLNYREQNLLGMGYGLSANVQISPSQNKSGSLNYTFGLDFVNPSIYDSAWNFSVSGSYNYQLQSITETTAANDFDVYIKQKSILASVILGREIIDHLRFTLGYAFSRYIVDPSVPLTQDYYQTGTTEEFTQSLVYDITDNASLPTSGLYMSAYNALGVNWTVGQYRYGTLSGNFAYYLPIYYTKNYKTNFRFLFIPRYVYQTTITQNIPYWKRLTLGNMYYMKGYTNKGETISPTVPVTINPATGQTINMYIGGNRSFYGSVEYFVPLIQEVGLRFVVFGEGGTVLNDTDVLNFSNLKFDVGFGFRWTTSMAPFRFEWAFPVKNGFKLGDSHFIFTVGVDSANL
jgi:outer membrane protein insertion porin family